MKNCLLTIAVAAFLAAAPGCKPPPADGPPLVRLDDSVCDQCNMIISDERWATATTFEGPRGPEARLFDDFNCQVNYEIEQADTPVLARWSHSHGTREWIRTENAKFLMSPNLRTPMGSQVAAFGSASEADAAKNEFTGDVITFQVAWKRLGFAGACCSADHSNPTQPEMENPDGP